ncbi:HLH-domain-containing protein [Hesseltinella vesiculosa]|uniref:HLH-domain-containing protein n=1 Tax=Hesseltinella vesiculosa TaxID=101127 RepID=A0A1X2GIA9_9FUNG|nr:HLH-domain-containing protein [Hesseltinella vesiculosa]
MPTRRPSSTSLSPLFLANMPDGDPPFGNANFMVIPSDDSSATGDEDFLVRTTHPLTPPNEEESHVSLDTLLSQPSFLSMLTQLPPPVKTETFPPSLMALASFSPISSHASTPAPSSPQKIAHNAIERRYRNNINDRIKELQKAVPALNRTAELQLKQQMPKHSDSDSDTDDEPEEEQDGVIVAKKLNKATILQKATEYIHHLKTTELQLAHEVALLQQVIQRLPGGAPLLSKYLEDKERRHQADKERRRLERKQSLAQERVDHQRMLKERAAHRASLLSPEERHRRRYQRRHTRQSASQPASAPAKRPRKKSAMATPSPDASPVSSIQSSPESSTLRLFSLLPGLAFLALPDGSTSSPAAAAHRMSKLVHHDASASFQAPAMSPSLSLSLSPLSGSTLRWLLLALMILSCLILPLLSRLSIRPSVVKKRLAHA